MADYSIDPQSKPARTEDRPVVAIITNSCPPYRLHAHRRIANEIPQIKLHSLFTHQTSDAAWAYSPPDEIGPVLFGENELAAQQGSIRHALHEWRKGGEILRWILDHRVRAVVIGGYNDLGRLRIIHWCHRHGLPCFLQADSNIRDDTATGLLAWVKHHIVSRVVRWCDGMLVCGTLGMEYFIKYGARPQEIFLYPYEPDYSLIRSISENTMRDARNRFGIKDGRKLLIYSGRLVQVKRVDLLIDAFAAIADSRPDWDLLIIGDGPLKSSLQNRLPDRLKSRVVWTGFLDDQPLVSTLYRLSDVLVLPSDREPWALVINEAAAAGLAIVASDVVGAAVELVRDGINGRIFRKGDVNQLVQCLLEVTDSARTDAMKSASVGVLEDWRQRGDPIEGLRKALRSANVIS